MSYDLILLAAKDLQKEEIDRYNAAIQSFAEMLGGAFTAPAMSSLKKGERFTTIDFRSDPRELNDPGLLGSFIRFARQCGLIIEDPQLGEPLHID
jgi:hypothetical protein